MTEPIEQPQNWHFTWGHGQTLPDGADAYNFYTIIHGTFHAARGEMFARFGQAWSFDYTEETGVEVAREYNMRFVEASRFPKRFEADGTTPLVAPSGPCGESVPQANYGDVSLVVDFEGGDLGDAVDVSEDYNGAEGSS